jgi:hypothetical protein
MIRVEKQLIETIDRTFGIAKTDTAALKEMMNKLESKKYIQVRILYYQKA